MPIADPQPVCVIEPKINALLYGPPGSGKTVLSASGAMHPSLGPVLIANFEGGLLSLGNPKNVESVGVKNMDEVEELFWKIVNKDPKFAKFKTVVLDSGSEMQTLSLEALSKEAYEKDKANKKKDEDKKRQSIDNLYQEDYGKDTSRLKRVFRWYRDAPVNVIITALSKKIYSKPPTKEIEPQLIDVCPAFTDKLGQSIMGYVDYVWYCYKDETDGSFNMLTSNKGVYKAKTRGMKFSKELGDVVKNPNLATLYDLLVKSESQQPEQVIIKK